MIAAQLALSFRRGRVIVPLAPPLPAPECRHAE